MTGVDGFIRLFYTADRAVLELFSAFIIDANHGIMRAAVKLRVCDCVADRIWLPVSEASECQRLGNQIDAAMR